MLHRFETIDSTNTYLKQLAEAGAEAGTAVIAHAQTGGRGRLGRSFHSPAGSGIYLSWLLRPNCKPEDVMHLTCAVAVAMCDAVEKATGLRPGIKWTNDLVYGKHKLGGILTELGFENGLVSYAVVGIGINCTQKAEDFPEEIQSIATSLAAVNGKPVDIAALEGEMLSALEAMAQTLADKETVLAKYRSDCVTIGQKVCVVRGEEISYGTALDVNGEGALVVRFDDGSVRAVSSGEVSVRGMYGYL